MSEALHVICNVSFRLPQESEARVQRQQLLFKKHATIGNVAGTGGVHSDVAAESNRGHDFELLPREYLDKVFPTTPDGYGGVGYFLSFDLGAGQIFAPLYSSYCWYCM
mgnify:CR=1 FL=1